MTDIDDAKHQILRRVADGSLSPSEAAHQLAALDADSAGNEVPTDEPAAGGTPGGHAGAATPPVAPATAEGPIRAIKIRGTFRAVEIIGDATVHEAVGVGSHVARHEGNTLVIDGGGIDLDDDDDDDDDEDWFRFGRGRGYGYRRMGMRLRSGAALQVRMNPELDLDAKVEAGPLTIKHVHGPIKARVAAGPLKIEDFAGPLDLHVSAGPIKARGVLNHGESHIQCEAGSVSLHLLQGSSVRVKASATLGKVNLFGEGERDRDRDRDRRRDRDFHWEDLAGGGVNRIIGDVLGKLGGGHEATVGGGEGTLEVEVAMGAVNINAD